MYKLEGVESDGSDLIGNMQSSFEGAEGHSQRKVDSSILEKNQQLKMDCLNNLSGIVLGKIRILNFTSYNK